MDIFDKKGISKITVLKSTKEPYMRYIEKLYFERYWKRNIFFKSGYTAGRQI